MPPVCMCRHTFVGCKHLLKGNAIHLCQTLQGVPFAHIELHNDVPAQAVLAYRLQSLICMCRLHALSRQRASSHKATLTAS